MKLGKLFVVLVLMAGLILVGGKALFADLLFLTNYDDGEKSTTNVKDFGAWDKDPDDPTQTCVISFDPDIHYGDEGMSLRLDYDVDSPNPAYNGFWMQLRNLDLSNYKSLVMYVKGDPEKGFSKRMKIELKTPKKVGRYMLKNISDTWQRVEIPLTEFKGIDSLEDVIELVFVFDDVNTRPKSGTIYIDNMYFYSE